MIIVEKNIPIPSRVWKHGTHGRYPYSEMKIGDSFLYPKNVSHAAASSGAYQWARVNKKKWRFACRMVNGKIRIWRVK